MLLNFLNLLLVPSVIQYRYDTEYKYNNIGNGTVHVLRVNFTLYTVKNTLLDLVNCIDIGERGA